MNTKSIVNSWGLLFMIVSMSNYALGKMLENFKGIEQIVIFIGTLLLSTALHYFKNLKN
jgi:hypothetical protein